MIDYYERRANKPSVEFARQAARVLGLSMAELLGEEVQNQTRPQVGSNRSGLQFAINIGLSCLVSTGKKGDLGLYSVARIQTQQDVVPACF